MIIAVGSAFTAANLFDGHARNPLGYGTGVYAGRTAQTFTGDVTSLSHDLVTVQATDISVSD